MKSIITKYIFLLKFSYEAAKPLVKVNFANSKLNTIKNKIESGDSRPFFVTKPELKANFVLGDTLYNFELLF